MENYFKVALITLIFLSAPQAVAYTNQCGLLFGNGLETHKPGAINIGWLAHIDGGSPELDAISVNQGYLNTPCNGHVCKYTGNAAPHFPERANDHWPSVAEKPKRVSAFANEALSGTTDGNYYSSLILGAFSQVVLDPGDYWFDSLNLGYNSRITQSGPGQLRLFVKNLTIGTSSDIGSEDYMVLIETKRFNMSSMSSAHAFVYVEGNAEIGNFAKLTGALSASNINLQSFSNVIYKESRRDTINYGWVCDYDQDGIYDGLDEDSDNDGFSNDDEVEAGTDPYNAEDKPADTDGDGIPDYKDDDIDNDGYTNSEEEAAGTDPYDAGSFPHPEPPSLKLATATDQTVYTDTLTVTGQVITGDLPLARVSVASADGVQLITVNGNGYFNISLALTEGLNSFVFDVQDQEGNSDSSSFNVTYIIPFSIQSVDPADGYTSPSDSVNATVILLSSSVKPSVRFGDMPLSLVSQSGNEYQFTGQVGLMPGDNELSLSAVADQRSIQQVIHYRYEPDEDSYPAPKIVIQSPADNTRTRRNDTGFYAEVTSQTGRLSALLNGNPVAVTELGDGRYSVSSAVDLQSGENTVTLTVTDALDKQATASVHIIQDKQAPEITLDNNWLPAPEINQLPDSTVILSGTLHGNDVSSLTVNGQEVTLSKISGEFKFSYSITIPPRQEVLLAVVAEDDLGNKAEKDYYLFSQSALTMSWISPKFPVTWFAGTGTGYPFAVRLADQAGTETYDANLMPGNINVAVQQAGSILTGTFPSQLDTGNYQLIVRATYGENSQELKGDIEVVNQADIPLEIVSVSPENQAQGIEPDVPVQVTFNRPVDPQLITFDVRKTLHGKTYVNVDESGADFLHSKGAQLQEVHYSREPVNGGYSVVNNDQTVVFYPSSDLGYNAEINWNILNNNKVISRQIFNTRSLPTFIEGGVTDTLGQSRAGLSVEIEELGIKAVTNNDGAYTFGYKTKSSENIPEGEYHIIVNGDGVDTSVGTIREPVSVTGGILNKLSFIRVPNINTNILPVSVDPDQGNVRLASGDLRIDLNGGRLQFPVQQKSIQAQFITASELARNVMEGLAPIWFYQIQPFGIQPDGAINLTIAMPSYMGSYDYLPGGEDGESYCLLLGYNQRKNIIEAVGVGKVTGTTLKSAEAVDFNTLDYIGYSPLLPDVQTAAEQYLNHQISLRELVAKARLERP